MKNYLGLGYKMEIESGTLGIYYHPTESWESFNIGYFEGIFKNLPNEELNNIVHVSEDWCDILNCSILQVKIQIPIAPYKVKEIKKFYLQGYDYKQWKLIDVRAHYLNWGN